MDLSLVLQKLGVKSVEELRPDEKLVFAQWQKVMGKPGTTLEDLKTALPKMLEDAQTELEKQDNAKERDLYWKAYVRLLKDIKAIILTPDERKAQLAAYLIQKYHLEERSQN